MWSGRTFRAVFGLVPSGRIQQRSLPLVWFSSFLLIVWLRCQKHVHKACQRFAHRWETWHHPVADDGETRRPEGQARVRSSPTAPVREAVTHVWRQHSGKVPGCRLPPARGIQTPEAPPIRSLLPCFPAGTFDFLCCYLFFWCFWPDQLNQSLLRGEQFPRENKL